MAHKCIMMWQSDATAKVHLHTLLPVIMKRLPRDKVLDEFCQTMENTSEKPTWKMMFDFLKDGDIFLKTQFLESKNEALIGLFYEKEKPIELEDG